MVRVKVTKPKKTLDSPPVNFVFTSYSSSPPNSSSSSSAKSSTVLNSADSSSFSNSSIRRSPRLASRKDLSSEETQKTEKTRTTSIPKYTFTRIVKSLARAETNKDLRWTKEAMDALQTASEAMVVELFDKMGFCAFVNGRKTIQSTDMAVALYRPQQNF